MDERILVTDRRLERQALRQVLETWFGDMVKFVADLRTGRMAVGGELHADGEARLLATGSAQEDLWGANYYPGRGEAGCLEFTSLINIRPARGNRGMELLDPDLRERLAVLAFDILGRGEPL